VNKGPDAWADLPHEEEEGQEEEKVVGLVVEDVVGDPVVEAGQVLEVGYGVVLRLADEVVDGPEGRELDLV